MASKHPIYLYTSLGILTFCSLGNAGVFVDDFNDNVTDSSFWVGNAWGGCSIHEENGQVVCEIPGTSHGTEGSLGGPTQFNAQYVSKNAYAGNFDIQIEYSLLTWPANNGVRLTLAMGVPGLNGATERVSLSDHDFRPPGDAYLIGGNDWGTLGFVPTEDLTGKLRLVRVGSDLSGYYWANGRWVMIGDYKGMSTQPASLAFCAFSDDRVFGHQDVKVAFDNFVFSQDDPISSVPEPSTCLAGLSALGMMGLYGLRLRK